MAIITYSKKPSCSSCNVVADAGISDNVGFLPITGLAVLMPVVFGGKYMGNYEYSSWDYYWNDLQAMFGAVFGQYYNEDLITVWNRINWNLGKSYGLSDAQLNYNKQNNWFENDPTRGKGYLKFEQLEKTLQSYQNRVLAKDKSKRIDEYVPSSKSAPFVIREVAITSGYSEQLVKRILDEVYYANQSNAFKENFIIAPLTYHANLEYRNEVPKGEPSPVGKANDYANLVGDKIKGLFDGIMTAVYVVGAVVVVGGIIYFSAMKPR
ncbi:MAG: hypothetical protein JNL32_00260 [Candidatus Kapabacteria bacterium]|nr:hypothetical protein [Candidatus Kapabacteria bacterium]